MSKFALSALILGILALFSYLVLSQSSDVPAESTELRTQLTRPPEQPVKAEQQSEQPPGNNVQSASSDLQRLSEDAKANSDKIAAVRSDLIKQIQDLKLNSDKAAQATLEQINALQSEQAKVQEASKETGNKAAQSIRDEIAATQAKLAAQVENLQKANTTRFEALGQRVDALVKNVDDAKRALDEDQRNMPSISPGVALVVALAALILGPFVAYQFMANQLAGVKQQAANATTNSQVAPNADPEVSRPPYDPSLRNHEEAIHHEAPPLGEEPGPQHETDDDRQPAHEPERT